ncbi:hypothetical protein BDZ91DRAFT_678718 [Kalaharituber pfeilii]|nr:hypothetical protein BDZ91DRAFT_678718 [Kalaharituber pfeilii]
MACPVPFLPLADYPATGGDIAARTCSIIPIDGLPNCCLPCPRQQWVYPDNFMPLVTGSTYLNLAGVACCVFILLSFLVLSVEYTNRHYLSVCLVAALLIMQISFVIPMGSTSNQCYDRITPHDMYSSANCALSGAFLLGGGWCVAMWIFLRTLSLHLQICWQLVPGRKFFLLAQAIGWSVPIVMLAIALAITGVSFRFGDSCHINSKNSLETFWGPLLGITAASIVTQIVTFVYCVKVYITSLLDDDQGNTSLDTPLPYATSVRTITPRQALRRIQRVIALQWRGIMVIIVIITDVIFFATVFLTFESTNEVTPENTFKAYRWLQCILHNNGDKNKCLHVAADMVVPQNTAIAVIYLLSCNGIWALLLIGRYSMLVGWWHLIRDLIAKKPVSDEFVSYNARRLSQQDPGYEMLGSRKTEHIVQSGIGIPLSTPGVLKTSQSTMQPSAPASFQSSWQGSGLSSGPNSPDISGTNQHTGFQSTTLSYKGDAVSEDEDYVHHALSPKPPLASYRRR